MESEGLVHVLPRRGERFACRERSRRRRRTKVESEGLVHVLPRRAERFACRKRSRRGFAFHGGRARKRAAVRLERVVVEGGSNLHRRVGRRRKELHVRGREVVADKLGDVRVRRGLARRTQALGAVRQPAFLPQLPVNKPIRRLVGAQPLVPRTRVEAIGQEATGAVRGWRAQPPKMVPVRRVGLAQRLGICADCLV